MNTIINCFLQFFVCDEYLLSKDRSFGIVSKPCKNQAKSTKPAAKKQPAQIEDDDDDLPAFHTQNAGPSGSKTQNSDLPSLSAMGPGPRGPRPWRSWGPGPMGPGPMGPMPMMGGPMGPMGPRMLGGPMGWGMGRGGPNMAFF